MDRDNLLKEIKNLDDGWSLNENTLARDFTFKDFNAALDFINKIGIESENLNHHPKIVNVYNKVRLELWSHDIDSISSRDIDLAKSVDEVFRKIF
tara:strand:- start:450 stop:734 length:285 start_codon:yes stop_codon:yes gene_type:complete